MENNKNCYIAVLSVHHEYDSNDELNVKETLKKFKKQLTAFCESILTRVDQITDFYMIDYSDAENPKPHKFIDGEEIGPYTLNLVNLTNVVEETLSFLTVKNYENFNPAGEEGIAVILHLDGLHHWDYNFVKVSQSMSDLSYAYDSFFRMFGLFEKDETKYFIETNYENGDYEDGFLPYYEGADRDIESKDVFSFIGDKAYESLDYYMLKKEMTEIDWYKK